MTNTYDKNGDILYKTDEKWLYFATPFSSKWVIVPLPVTHVNGEPYTEKLEYSLEEILEICQEEGIDWAIELLESDV